MGVVHMVCSYNSLAKVNVLLKGGGCFISTVSVFVVCVGRVLYVHSASVDSVMKSHPFSNPLMAWVLYTW